MVKLIEWCYRRAPRDARSIGTYTMIDSVRDKILPDYLLKRSHYDMTFLRTITVDDLVNIAPEEQYITLLAHIFCNDIQNVRANNMITFISWMLRDVELYETGLIAYVWNKSCLNSMSSYPSHVAMLQVADSGCDRRTLQFLWDVALSEDMFLCTVVSAMELIIGSETFIKMASYLYICSGVNVNDILAFISDVQVMSDEQIYKITNLLTLYTWDKDTLTECLTKGYSIGKLEKYLKQYAETSFIQEGRHFPTNKLSGRVFRVRNRFKETDVALPSIPSDYEINYHMWNNRYPMKKIRQERKKSRYELWFESLTDSQLKKFKSVNPVAYSACVEGNIHYVEKILDEIMSSI